jgi:hypothetical protein
LPGLYGRAARRATRRLFAEALYAELLMTCVDITIAERCLRALPERDRRVLVTLEHAGAFERLAGGG